MIQGQDGRESGGFADVGPGLIWTELETAMSKSPRDPMSAAQIQGLL